MFSLNDRVKHLASGMLGTVLAQRLNLELSREEIRVLFDEHSAVSSWAPAKDYSPA